MKNEDGTFGLKYRHVRNRETGEVIVVPPEDADAPRIDQSATFYHDARDKGNITCFDCESADMIHIAGYDQAGSKIHVRNHFKLAHGQHHGDDCLVKMRVDDDPTSRVIDLTKGPVIFLNGLPERVSAKGKFHRASRNLPIAPPLITRDEKGKMHINDEDLDNRRRMNAKTPEDIFRIMRSRSMNRDLLNHSFIINNDKAIPWRKFFVAPGDGKQEPMYNRHIRLVEDMLRDPSGKHAVMLNFTLDRPAKPVFKEEKTPRTETFRLAGSEPAEPVAKQVERQRIALPVITMVHPLTNNRIDVRPLVHIKNPDLYKEFATLGADGKVGEFFMLGQPYLNQRRGDDNFYFLNFDLRRADHIVRHSLADLRAEVLKRPAYLEPAAPVASATPA